MRRKNSLDEMMHILNELNKNTDLMMGILKDMNSIKYKADKISSKNESSNYKNHYVSQRSCYKDNYDSDDDFFYKLKKFLIKLNG